MSAISLGPSAVAPAVRMPALYVSHGGGPMPVLGDPSHREISAFFRSVKGLLPARCVHDRSCLLLAHGCLGLACCDGLAAFGAHGVLSPVTASE